VVLWAWEWKQDLRFLTDRPGVEVAFLAATIELEVGGPRVLVRRQPLWVPPRQRVTAVVHLEADHGGPVLGPVARRQVVEAFLAAAALPRVQAVQSDFDAPASLRADYTRLLAEVRAALPSGVGLGMTALGSWCSGDDWLGAVAGSVDEIVPMLFSMGRGGREVWQQIAADGDLRSPHCRSSLGLATYEEHPPVPRGRRLYLFHRGPWTEAAFERALAKERP
jgi:hypothetical protein